MLSFAPPKRSRIIAALAFFPLLAAAGFFTWASIRAAHVGTRLSAHAERKVEDGPVALHGAVGLLVDTPRSPLGDEAAGWVGAVGSWRAERGEQSVFGTRCGLGGFDSVALRTSGSVTFRLALLRPDEDARVGAAAIGWGGDTRIGLDLGPLAGEDAAPHVREAARGVIPEVVKKTCAKAIADLGEEAVYRERVLPPGTEVTVLACKRGNDVVACRDGLDTVASAPLDDMKSRVRSGLGGLLLLGGFVSLLVLAGAGATALSFATRTRRTFR